VRRKGKRKKERKERGVEERRLEDEGRR